MDARYESGEKGRARRLRYNQSEKGLARTARHAASRVRIKIGGLYVGG